MSDKLIIPYTMLSGAPLVPNELAEKLMENWREMERHLEGLGNGTRKSSEEPAQVPVLKLFHPLTGHRWLLVRVNPDDLRVAYGLADLGLGCPEIGYIHLDQLAQLQVSGLPIERDLYITLDKSLIEYWDEWTAEADGQAS